LAIAGHDETSLQDFLNQILSSSQPIRSAEFLLGRENNLRDIQRNLATKGRHVFIFGDRGVGKTSLAQTAATEFHPSDSEPIVVAGAEGETFGSIIGSIINRSQAKTTVPHSKERETTVNLPFISHTEKKITEGGKVPEINFLSDAIDALNYVASCHSKTPVVVIDEFESFTNDDDKKKFAALIKHISDQDIDIKVIFCGIGESMHSLLGSHYSAGRAISPIELPRLDHESLVRIVENAGEKFGLSVDPETSQRVAILSDGFPYFAHLVAEHMIWAAFDDEAEIRQIAVAHFGSGINAAVTHTSALLRNAYDTATKKYNDTYEEVLWALVDRPTLMRQSAAIYKESYCPIMDKVGRAPLPIKTFYNRLNSLKAESHGNILQSPRRGWFAFSENMVRGYVKLKAAERRIDLGIDHHNSEASRGKKLNVDFYQSGL